ncbi:hypothetical protein ACFSTA_04740 [Ornithinibacillus salinisoli]|uniref:Uncharacterized protein n=1 Tax=Ornithinibacillus salinisoli TaxID=1848459 RepID=A0ABW4VY39_9BACI
MLKRIFVLFLLSILFISACSETNPQNYMGVSENWGINYGRDEKLVIKYNGDDPIPEEQLTIKIDEGVSNATADIYLSEEGIYEMNLTFSEEPNDAEIIMEWNGQTESINLKEI